MTLYWWTHWFWITAIIIITAAVLRPAHSWPLANEPHRGVLNTSPFHTPASAAQQARYDDNDDDDGARQPLSFPRPAVELTEAVAGGDGDGGDDDTDDVFNGRALVETTFHEEWLSAGPATKVRLGALEVVDATHGKGDLRTSEVATMTTKENSRAVETASVTRRPSGGGGQRTTIVPIEDIIATRLSTRKWPAGVDRAGNAVQVARVNVTMIRSTARSNKSANLTATSTTSSSSASSSSSSSASSTSSRITSNTSSKTSTTSINTSRSQERIDADPAPESASASSDSASGSDEERHNYTNDLLAVPPPAGAGKMANEKATQPPSGGRQSKVLLTAGNPATSAAEALEGQQHQQQRSALEANLVNYTGATKSLLGQMSAPLAMNAEASRESESESRALPVKRSVILDAGAISGICIAAVALCGAVSAGGIFLYRRRLVNKPQTLSEPDSTGYIDDSINRDNSDEMYSLDNDSFLNSLEAMTIQNYWTENVKHTKL